MHKNGRKYTLEDEQVIRDFYISKGPQYCADLLGRNVFCIHNKAARLGIKFSKADKKLLHIKARERDPEWYDVNPTQFFDIRLPEAAYLLGFLWADGHIKIREHDKGVTNYIFSLEIADDDYQNIAGSLKKLGNWKVYTRMRKERAKKNVTTIRTGNKPLVVFLIEHDYGVKSKESPTKILSRIPDYLKHYFWRGFCDGDGHIKCDADGPSALYLAGSYEQDWTEHLRLMDGLGIKIKVDRRVTKSGSSSGLLCQNIACVAAWGEYIYTGRETDGIGLDRKYQAWQRAISRKAEMDKRNLLVLDEPTDIPFSKETLFAVIKKYSGVVSVRKLVEHFGWKANIISSTVYRHRDLVRSDGHTLSQRYVYIGHSDQIVAFK
jgi:hypothetical protein